MDRLDTIESPNFSIILPGPCQAHCEFCFWKRDPRELAAEAFIGRLEYVLSKLPQQFWKCSITGGEPLLSPVLFDVLALVRRRFDKVVFTTNGGIRNGDPEKSLLFRAPDIAKYVDFVNISRHDRNNEHNDVIFGAPMNWCGYIKRCVTAFNQHGIRVTNNCVLPTKLILAADLHIAWAKETGFSSVCFRKRHEVGGDLSPTPEENGYKAWKVVQHGECPVCRSDTQIIDGIEVIWTVSLPEPAEVMTDKVYEAVLHPDGTLSADWSKQIEIVV